jgi:hypothetical protein
MVIWVVAPCLFWRNILPPFLHNINTSFLPGKPLKAYYIERSGNESGVKFTVIITT